jgi:hypothetical protein
MFKIVQTISRRITLLLALCLAAPAVLAQPVTDVVFNRQAPPSYIAGQVIEITVNIGASYPESITALGLYETIPPGWTFVGLRGITSEPPAIAPAPGQDSLLEFAWITPPSFPAAFAYSLQSPANATDVQYITGQVEYRESGQAEKSNVETTELNGPPKPDTKAPVITLEGGNSISLRMGESWSEPGYTAMDDVDGDITNRVTVSGVPNTSQPGISTLTYSVTDKAGRTGTAQRTVRVTGRTNSGGGYPGNYDDYDPDTGTGTDTGTDTGTGTTDPGVDTGVPAQDNGMAAQEPLPVPAGVSNVPAPPVVPPGQRKPLDQARLGEIMSELRDKEVAADKAAGPAAAGTAAEASASPATETVPESPAPVPAPEAVPIAAPAEAAPTGSVPPPADFGVPAAPEPRAAAVSSSPAAPVPGFFTRVGQRVSSMGAADYGLIGGGMIALVALGVLAGLAWKGAYGGSGRRRGGPAAK